MTKNLPVSDTKVELRLCSCRTGCTKRSSTCKKDNLLSPEISLCVNCFNEKSDNEKSDKEKIDSNSDVDLLLVKNHRNQ